MQLHTCEALIAEVGREFPRAYPDEHPHVFQTPCAAHLLQQPQPHHGPRALRAGGAQRRPGQLHHPPQVSAGAGVGLGV